MKKIALIGYGELAVQIEKFIIQQNTHRPVFYRFDDILFSKKSKNSFKFSDYISDKFADFDFYVCLGYKQLPQKKKIIEMLLKKKRNLPALIHRTAYVSPEAEIKPAAVIYPLCNIDKNTVIGSGALLNNSVVVSHDNEIGPCSYLSPGVVTSGFVKVGDCSFLGSGSLISNYVKIGKACTIGIGSVVTGNLPAGSQAIGNPLKILRNKLEIH